MIKNRRIKVLLIAPYFDRETPGESWCTFKWVEQICKLCDTTVLTTHKEGWDSELSPVSAKELVNWTHPVLSGRLARLDWELKPHYLLFYSRARRWIRKAIKNGFEYDIVHQINPVALRYPSPVRNLGLPFITGPHAGSLETPKDFLEECPEGKLFRNLRKLDKWRIKYDPVLRNSFASASVVLGVAPYLKEFFSSVEINRFEIMAETGPEVIVDEPRTYSSDGEPLKLLFVGRIIRTKGVIDAIRAVALALKCCSVTLDIVGTGDMLDACIEESKRLGIEKHVIFHGRIPRTEVYECYRNSDVFLFPSFREPSGTVVFEAMGFGLPMITSANGGPGYAVTDECGIRIETVNPRQYASDLASAIIDLARNRLKLNKMSESALMRVNEIASWEQRGETLLSIYEDTLCR